MLTKIVKFRYIKGTLAYDPAKQIREVQLSNDSQFKQYYQNRDRKHILSTQVIVNFVSKKQIWKEVQAKKHSRYFGSLHGNLFATFPYCCKVVNQGCQCSHDIYSAHTHCSAPLCQLAWIVSKNLPRMKETVNTNYKAEVLNNWDEKKLLDKLSKRMYIKLKKARVMKT